MSLQLNTIMPSTTTLYQSTSYSTWPHVLQFTAGLLDTFADALTKWIQIIINGLLWLLFKLRRVRFYLDRLDQGQEDQLLRQQQRWLELGEIELERMRSDLRQ
ncbi:hypothetical protein M409DRAFT_22736 [Zasmidium cellare ATCC 36951]|uniref:Uncharacterized protein n=1 Tax=Zasmidium cellare ATCC 36951 TaxID=1080233 RepID=A0A6A6CNJ9_ZASCE|nr:uncharacterized protein M409DRAFT_22736 [Zasmidium cellare ATCC 36951]KAF2167309.1 hypothetical protein M409DRAFT_22736 [Zasmidium cellare ATCC 36951]